MTDHVGLKLHSTMDASIWAKEFCKLNPEVDEGVMLSWFANAIMAGYDIAYQQQKAKEPKLTNIAHHKRERMRS